MAKWSNEKMADLTRKLADTAIEQNELYQAALRDSKEAEDYIEELEANLAKAVGHLLNAAEQLDGYVEYGYGDEFREAAAELTGGQKDGNE